MIGLIGGGKVNMSYEDYMEARRKIQITLPHSGLLFFESRYNEAWFNLSCIRVEFVKSSRSHGRYELSGVRSR